MGNSKIAIAQSVYNDGSKSGPQARLNTLGGKMGKKTILIILATGLLVGGVWWFGLRDTSDSDSQSQQPSEESTSNLASLNDLLSRNQDLMCVYSDSHEDGTTSSGTVYLSRGRMSGSFSTSSPGEDHIKGHIISDGQSQYTWEEGSDEGVKFDLSQAQTDAGDMDEPDSDQTASIDRDTDYQFQCEEWAVDEAVFTPPANVEFKDFDLDFEGVSEALKAACAQITDPSQKAACESQL